MFDLHEVLGIISMDGREREKHIRLGGQNGHGLSGRRRRNVAVGVCV